MSNKGMELAIGTVTIMAIILIVLIVVASFFLGGFGEGTGGIQNILGGASGEAEGLEFQGTCKAYSGGAECQGITDSRICRGTSGCYWSYVLESEAEADET